MAWADDDFEIHISDAALSKESTIIGPTDMQCRALALEAQGQRLLLGKLNVWAGRVTAWRS